MPAPGMKEFEPKGEDAALTEELAMLVTEAIERGAEPVIVVGILSNILGQVVAVQNTHTKERMIAVVMRNLELGYEETRRRLDS